MPRKKYMGKKPKNVVPEPKFAGGGIASGMRRFNRGGKVK